MDVTAWGPSRSPKTRTRSGCLSCRFRKKKCDGVRPVCSNCWIRRNVCHWGLKLSFHPSRALSLSTREAADLRRVERQRRHSASSTADNFSSQFTIIDDTENVLRSFGREPTPATHISEPVTPSSSGIVGEEEYTLCELPTSVDFDPDGLMPTEDVDWSHLINQSADSFPPVTTRSYPDPIRDDLEHVNLPVSSGSTMVANDPLAPIDVPPINEVEKAHLIQAYLQEAGTWCETTDSDMHFTVKSVHELMDSPVFSAAALALASRQIDAVTGRPNPRTLELYQYTIRQLISHNPANNSLATLSCCILLCVYEMMGSRVEEWRRHLRGCSIFLKNAPWASDRLGAGKTCFWAFARIDLWAAFISAQKTLIPTDSWVVNEDPTSVANNDDMDDFGNLAILIFAKIVNLCATVENHYTHETVAELWTQLQLWWRARPKGIQPLHRTQSSVGSPIPTIIYSRSSAICGNTFYHTGCIILLQTKLIKPLPEEEDNVEFDPILHARELIATSICNRSHANWVNQVQPLFIAGRALNTMPGDWAPTRFMTEQSAAASERIEASTNAAFAVEKMAVLQQLRKIECETGWRTSDRAKQLRQMWKLE